MNIKFDLSQSQADVNDSSDFSSKYCGRLQETLNSKEIGFYSTLNEERYLSASKKTHEKFKARTRFFHVGIGGSSLGPEMLLSALGKTNDVSFEYINNVDPDVIHESLSKISNIDDCLFYVVSKSGGTAETIASLIIIINILKDRFDIDHGALQKYIVLCTDENNGDLRKLATDLNLESLIVPTDVGGRFSVLTPVGFLPALFAGINCDLLIQSATKYGKELLDGRDSDLFKCGLALSKHMKSNITQTVLMPYSSKLKNFTSWFVQLWAESLGKKEDLNGKVVHTGLTPISAYGSTDQHSQMQLFMDGPRDKAFFLLNVQNFEHDFTLENSIDLASFQLLSKSTMAKLMQAEYTGAKQAMAENNLPVVSIAIDSVNENSVGQLIIFFELLTALMGSVLEVNPFDQPGVELGKVYTKQILSNT